jgi:hypothetical protein
MEYYLTINRNEVLMQVTTWMNLKYIVLSEKSQSQRAVCIMIMTTYNVRVVI